MKTKIGINGFGRIGRTVLKNIIKHHKELDVVAVNDLADPETLLHLFRYDSVYGIEEGVVKNNALFINESKITVFSEKDPANLPWKDLGVDIVLECTGLFTDHDNAQKHLQAGAKLVIISAPSKDPEKIPSFILGVNDNNFNPREERIVDMGSCTTNCLAPIAKVLHENYGIKKGMMTTIHSYTAGQNLLDGPHKDLRRARAAALSIVPTTTGATKAIGRVLPELDGKLFGLAFRVPTPTVSIVDLVCIVKQETTAEEVNYTLKKYSHKAELKQILGVEDAPLVSVDYVGNSFSAVVDSDFTQVDGELVKVVAWYDNEWAYAKRLAEFAQLAAEKLK